MAEVTVGRRKDKKQGLGTPYSLEISGKQFHGVGQAGSGPVHLAWGVATFAALALKD